MCGSFISACKRVALGRIVPPANSLSLQRDNSPSIQDLVSTRTPKMHANDKNRTSPLK